MPFLRSLPARRFQAFARPAIRTQRAAFTTTRPSLASQDYGSGAGDPKGEDPQSQGPNPSADKEHPGPPPPAAGKGTGSTPTKGGDQSSNQGDKGGSSKGTQAAQPKILNDSMPKEGQDSPDVAQHNREMDQRAEKTSEKVTSEEAEKDKVGKDFWRGQGGADRQP